MGSHILDTLMSLEHQDLDIVAACRDPGQLLPAYNGEVRVGDLRDPEYLDRVLVGVDVICHAAGWSSFEKASDTCRKAYLEPTLNLVNHAIEWRISRFINLSSLFILKPSDRNRPEAIGRPRRYWPMSNCLLAVEEYLKSLGKTRCQFVNLRAGVYAGKRLNLGLLPLLLARSKQTLLPHITGFYGHLPIVDGRDIGQAFARAALAPINAHYSNLHIAGAESPTQTAVMHFLQQELKHKSHHWGMPALISSPLIHLLGSTLRHNKQPLFTRAMLEMLKNPSISVSDAHQKIGYDPQTSWQASLLDAIESHKNHLLNNQISQNYRDFLIR